MSSSFHIPCPFCEESAGEAFALAGRAPDFVARPGSESDCAELIRWAAFERCALVPWGGGTAIPQGNPLRAARWVAVRTDGLSGVTEYSPDDMVVTCGAGTALSALQSVLGERRQLLPLDPPQADRATLGGIVATNAHGLWRPAFGVPRDRLLGIRVAMADGSLIHGGGKVVKNVAGYDLCKLFTGSWGTLGLITEATFKTNPLPESRIHRSFGAPSLAAAAEAALAIHTAKLEPAYLIASLLDRPTLTVGLIGGAEACAWQDAEIARRLQTAGLEPCDAGPAEDALRHAHVGSAAEARLAVRPTDIPALVRALEQMSQSKPLEITASVTVGVLDVSVSPETAQTEEGIPRELRDMLPPGGHLTWPRAPQEWRIPDAWGPTRGDFALMQRLKTTLDPDGLFSPGRFAGRL